jgi:D-arabinose 1-dehydrogenase-like Zn-dependent alcohol dehydrogenase
VFIEQTFELEDAAKALDAVANGHVHGKVVLRIQQR